MQLGEISKHEAYNRALKHPQLKCQEASEMVFDNKFCAAFKLSEHAVINKLEAALSQQVRIDMILINVDEDAGFKNVVIFNCFKYISILYLFIFKGRHS